MTELLNLGFVPKGHTFFHTETGITVEAAVDEYNILLPDGTHLHGDYNLVIAKVMEWM